jgi:hypothetical protein
MHSSTLAAGLLLALFAGGCRKQVPEAAAGSALLPDYRTRGIVVVDPNPQRANFWDFDAVPHGERVTHVFKLKNLETKTVTLRSLQPSCGCLLPTLRSAGQPLVRGMIAADAPPFQLAPQAEAELELQVDTTLVERMNVDKLVWVRIICDAENSPFLAFEAHVKVTREFQCAPGLIDLGEVPQGYGKRGTGTVITDSRVSKATILGVARVEGPFVASVDETETGGVRNWLLVVDAQEDAPLGVGRGKVVLRTSGSDGTGEGRPFEVPVNAQFVPRILARPAQVRLSLVKDSAAVTVECLVPGEKVQIKNVRFEGAGPDFAGEAIAENPDGLRASKWKVVFRLTAKGAQGGFTRTAVLELDDAKIPELRVPVTVETQ